MSYDELELDLVGDRKTALFVIISDTDDTFNFYCFYYVHTAFLICSVTELMMYMEADFQFM